MKLNGTKTAENLLKAFAGESQASNRYDFFAKIADKEGYKQIAAIFLETSRNERVHAKRFYKLLAEGFEGELPVDITINDATYPVEFSNTARNLKAAAMGENEEWTDLYPEFARVAKEEGFPEVHAAFTNIAKAEVNHEARFLKLLENIETDKVFEKDEVVRWKCDHCGYIHEGKEAPKVCPSCLHPQGYFEVYKETF